MQAQRREAVRYQGVHCCSHIASAGEGLANPIPDTARLSHAAPNIGDGQSAHHGIILGAEDQVGVGQIAALILSVSLESSTKCAEIGRASCRERGYIRERQSRV